MQVRIRHERPTERDQVGIALRQDPLGAHLVVFAGDNDLPREARTNGLAEFLGELRRIVPVRPHQVQMDLPPLLFELPGDGTC